MATASGAGHERSRRPVWILGGLGVLVAALIVALIVTSAGDDPGAPGEDPEPPTAEPVPPAGDDDQPPPPPPVEPPVWRSAQPYSEDSPWNTPLEADAPVHERSEEFVARIGEELTSDTSQYTLPVYEVDADTPTVEVRIIHLFSDVTRDGTTVDRQQEVVLDVPVPDGAEAATGTDAQIVLVNTDTGEEWGFWQFEPEGEGYVATNGYRYHVGWNAVPPDGFGSRGAGVPYLTGLIRPAELERGRLDHAIAFAYATPSPEHVFPATKSDGQGDPDLDLPEGARLRLDPSLDEADLEGLGLSEEGMIIARALQEYGMILIDVAGRPKIYAEYEETAGWGGAVTEDTVSALPLESFEVIDWEEVEVGPLAQPTAPESAPIGSDIVLDGSASYEPGGEITAYEWTDATGRTVGEEATIRYPSGDLEPGTHRFDLRVAGNPSGWSEPRQVYVTTEIVTGPYVAATQEVGGIDVDRLVLPSAAPADAQSAFVAVALRRLNAEDDVAVADVVGGGRSWERVVREVDERGALTLEVWAAAGVDSGSPDQGVRVELDGRTNLAVQSVALANAGPPVSIRSAHGDGDAGEAELEVEGYGDGLVLGFHAGRTEDFVLDGEGEVNVANTTVNDQGGSLRLSSLTVLPDRDRRVEVGGSTRSPMDWAMAALSLTRADD